MDVCNEFSSMHRVDLPCGKVNAGFEFRQLLRLSHLHTEELAKDFRPSSQSVVVEVISDIAPSFLKLMRQERVDQMI